RGAGAAGHDAALSGSAPGAATARRLRAGKRKAPLAWPFIADEPTRGVPASAFLFEPLSLRQLPLKDRVVISPICTYSAVDGMANDFHCVHLGRFALGGAGLVIVEATAVQPEGRISHGDMGLWNDAQVEPLARIAAFLKQQGAAAGIQLAHAGRK